MTTFDLRTETRTGIEMGLGADTEPAGAGMSGWPYTDFARGWYHIGYSQEIAPGQVKPAKWLNQDLVVFRTESGKLAVLDAYCPHMGAHLGRPGQFGGGICGETLRCPWHGWRWGTDGSNVEIPYRPDQPLKVKVGRQHVQETDGCIMLWYANDGSLPDYDWPGLPYLGDKSGYYPIDTTVDGPHLAKPQLPHENSADPHHFPHVHGSGFEASFGDYEVDGAFCTNAMSLMFGAGKDTTWLTPDGPVEGTIDNFFWGASLGIARFHIGDMVCIHLLTLTPIDHERSIFFSTVTATREPGDTGDVPQGRSGKMMAAQHWQIRNDFHIWQHMSYRVKPLYVGSEEKERYAFIRRHFDQFYPNPVYGQTSGTAG